MDSGSTLQVGLSAETLELLLRKGVLHLEDVQCLNQRSHRKILRLVKRSVMRRGSGAG